MNIDSINNIGSIRNTDIFNRSSNLNKTSNSFSEWLQNEISVANTQINEADTKLREYAVGGTDNLHQVMMSIEEAKTSFELIVQVRNRLLDGYQEIMRMQI